MFSISSFRKAKILRFIVKISGLILVFGRKLMSRNNGQGQIFFEHFWPTLRTLVNHVVNQTPNQTAPGPIEERTLEN